MKICRWKKECLYSLSREGFTEELEVGPEEEVSQFEIVRVDGFALLLTVDQVDDGWKVVESLDVPVDYLFLSWILTHWQKEFILIISRKHMSTLGK